MITYRLEQGRVIDLLLLNGTSDGIIEAKMRNWSGQLTLGNSSTLEELLAHEEARKSGVYILQGDDHSSSKERVYIGYSNKITERLRQHADDDDKSFWNKTCLITSTDDTLDRGNSSYLETLLIETTRESSRAALHNATKPSSEHHKITKSGKVIVHGFLENLKIILPIVRFDFLKPLQARLSNIEDYMFELKHKTTGIHAVANEINGDFYVLKDSQATTKGREKSVYREHRAALLKEGVLAKGEGKHLVFTKDYLFSSPSRAASIIIDGQASGFREWKVKGEKTNYREWQEEQAKKRNKTLI